MTPFDPGLQPERTGLAWRRTSLALFVGSLLAMRILPEVLGAWAMTLGLAGAVAAGALLWAVHRRYTTHHRQLIEDGDRTTIAGGYLVAATTMCCVLTAALALVLVAVMAATGSSRESPTGDDQSHGVVQTIAITQIEEQSLMPWTSSATSKTDWDAFVADVAVERRRAVGPQIPGALHQRVRTVTCEVGDNPSRALSTVVDG